MGLKRSPDDERLRFAARSRLLNTMTDGLRMLAWALAHAGARLIVAMVVLACLLLPGQSGSLSSELQPNPSASELATPAGWTQQLQARLQAFETTQEGRPLSELVFPALWASFSRLAIALMLVLVLGRKLALLETPLGATLRRLLQLTQGIPLFLASYLLIIVINRLVFALVAEDQLPAWFALPLGDGEPHAVKAALQLALLVLGDGALARASLALRTEVLRLNSEPYVVASMLNGQQNRALERHLNRRLAPLACELLPVMVGSLMVVELMFAELGAGRLLFERLESHDGAVVFAVGLGLLLLQLGPALATELGQRRQSAPAQAAPRVLGTAPGQSLLPGRSL